MPPGGVATLSPLYNFVRKHSREWRALVLDGSEQLGNDYVECCKVLLREVPSAARGVYLWGFYNHSGFWVNVYLGKSGLKKTANLHGRLFKELTQERASIWREVFPGKRELLDFAEPAHTPRMWPKNKKEWVRFLRKAGSTHIYWADISYLSEDDVEPIEKDLIEAMNPTGNRKRNSPPSQTRRDEAIAIFRVFREMIDRRENRESGFPLKYHKEFWKWVGETAPEP
jgi:hypothetical protein